MTVSAASPGTQHTAQLPPRPQTRRVTSMFLPAARPHQCPLHQPGPLHTGQVATAPQTHAPARPTPCKCRQCPHPFPCHAAPTQQPAHNTWQRHSTAPLPPPPDSVAEPPPHSYRPLPALPTHHQQFAGDVGTQVGHGNSGGWATSTRAAAVAALCPPPP
jgi:hypothetical protein